MRYVESLRTVIRGTNYSPAPAPWNKGIPVHQTRSQHHETARGWLTQQCYRTQTLNLRGRRITAKHLRITDGVGPAQTETIPARVDRRESMQKTGRGWIGAGGLQLQGRLARGCADAEYLWLGYPPGRRNGQTQSVSSPPRPT